MGAAWWFIKDVLVLPHGEDTLARQMIAYGLMGGVLVGTIVHPVNFIYGFLMGSTFGGVKVGSELLNMPRGIEWKIKGTDEEKRRRLLREDEEYEMSLRNALTTKTNLYPL